RVAWCGAVCCCCESPLLPVERWGAESLREPSAAGSLREREGPAVVRGVGQTGLACGLDGYFPRAARTNELAGAADDGERAGSITGCVTPGVPLRTEYTFD